MAGEWRKSTWGEEVSLEYGFARHRGYGTAAHIQALLKHGPIDQHRQSFRPVHDIADIRRRRQLS